MTSQKKTELYINYRSLYEKELNKNKTLQQEVEKLSMKLDTLIDFVGESKKITTLMTVKDIRSKFELKKFKYIKRFFEDFFYDNNMRNKDVITNEIVEALCDKLNETDRYAHNTKKTHFNTLMSMFSKQPAQLAIVKENASKKPTEASEKIALSPEEFDRLEKLIPENQTEEIVLDFAILMCRIGARISDILDIKPSNFDNGVLTYVAKKNRRICKVRVSKKTMAMIFKVQNYNIKRLDCFNVTFNKTLQELGKKAHIDKVVKVFKGGKDNVGPKYAFMTAHSCRTTCATISYMKGKPLEYIRQMLGHSNVRQTEHYIKAGFDIENENIEDEW